MHAQSLFSHQFELNQSYVVLNILEVKLFFGQGHLLRADLFLWRFLKFISIGGEVMLGLDEKLVF